MAELLDLESLETLIERSRNARTRNARCQREWARRTKPGRPLTREEALSGVRPTDYVGHFNPCRACGMTIPFGDEYFSDYSLPGDVFGICVSCHEANLRACQDCGKLLRRNRTWERRGRRCHECWASQTRPQAPRGPADNGLEWVLALVLVAMLGLFLMSQQSQAPGGRCTSTTGAVTAPGCP